MAHKEPDEDKKEEKKDEIGASTIFKAMMEDKAADQAMVRQLMELEKTMIAEVYKIRLEMQQQAEDRTNELKDRIRQVDRDHWANRDALKNEIAPLKTEMVDTKRRVSALEDDPEIIRDAEGVPITWWKQPKHWKAAAKAIAIIIAVLVAAFVSAKYQIQGKAEAPREPVVGTEEPAADAGERVVDVEAAE